MEQKREQDLGKRQTERSDEELALSAAKCSDSTAELISRYMKLIWVKANTMANAVVRILIPIVKSSFPRLPMFVLLIK